MNSSIKWKLEKIMPYVILVIVGLIFLLPLLWVIIASLDQHAIQSIKMPEKWTVQNYIDVISDKANQRSFATGLLTSLGQSFFVVVFASLAAYPLSRYQLKYNNMLLYSLLFMTALPITTVMVPVYRQFLVMNLYDSTFGVLLFFTASALPYGIWMMKNYMDAISIDIEEAAWVDGATTMQTIVHIVAPLLLPGISVVAIFTFSGSWGNFFTPYILLNTLELFPPSVMLYQFMGQYGMISYGPLAAYSILYSLPSIVLYAFSQKYMSQGFTMSGASKG